jgi:predicted SAM-dependent methyltransferase
MMWLVRQLKYGRRLITRMERMYQRRWGARGFQRRVASAPVKRIVLGASSKHDRGWIPTEMGYLDLLKSEHWERAMAPGTLDALLAEHVWEHLTLEEARTAATTCHTYLKPGGYLRIAVPDGFHPSPEYIGWVKPGGASPGQLANDHKVLYTYRTLADLFEAAGFQVKLYEYFDESGKFHYSEWDPAAGTIRRSKRFDKRNTGGSLTFTSIVMDAIKPGAVLAAVS